MISGNGVDEPGDESTGNLPRRGVLASLAAGGGAALGAGALGPTTPVAYAGTAHNIRYVGAGDTIQDAVNAVGTYGQVVVTDAYDSSKESFPITIRERVRIVGNHGTKIRNRDRSTNIFDVRVGGIRPPGPVFENLHLQGGSDAFNVYDSRYCIFQNVHIEQPDNDGITLYQSDGPSNTHRLYAVSVEQAGRHGFYIGRGTHAVDLVSCGAQECGNDGLHIDDAYTTTVLGGVYQYNTDKGIHAIHTNALAVYNAYLESNDASNYNELVLNKVAGAVIDGCYFSGLVDESHNQNGIYLTSCHYVDIRTATFRCAVALIDMTADNGDIDINRGTHFPITGDVLEDAASERVRSHGVIGAGSGGVDLGSTTGQWVGDMAVSDGSAGVTKGLTAVWTGSAWQPSDGGSPV